MSKALYNAKSLSTGGGRDGHVATSDRQIDVDVRPPKELGGSGEGTNPEQLVAAGWAACFNGALQKQMKDNDVDLSKAPEVLVECTLNSVDEGFRITSRIEATLFGVEQAQADELVQAAHAFCPYSKAMRGDTDVEVVAKVA
ncbi:organic hydroperoxide resistance protein [Corynebacterium sp.]|uniref:organic hydroperoxide resistance protein n=1 Tax=Corynebacterium sp. TaxID=1720 RepID=UPI0026280E63|nr:organic hydroperoxide resistance protein [Corynebacterium sp.]